MSNPIRELNEIKRNELSEFFDKHGGSKKKPWNTKEWKERRSEIIDDECEWCGAPAEDATLQLHHYEEPEFNWDHEWISVEDNLFIQSDAFDLDQHVEEPSKCPECFSSNFYARKTVAPTYRCRRCEHEFPDADGVRLPDLIAATGANVYATSEFFVAKLEWVRDSGNRQAVREAFKDAHDEHWERYLSLERTITICKSCHFRHHKKGMELCVRCEDDLGKYRRDDDLKDYYCWGCLVDLRGLALCLECGDNWHDPARTDYCSDCR